VHGAPLARIAGSSRSSQLAATGSASSSMRPDSARRFLGSSSMVQLLPWNTACTTSTFSTSSQLG
jgi:hypothetical protein